MTDNPGSIARRIDERFYALTRWGPTDDEYGQRYLFKFLRSLCRARDRARLTPEQSRRLTGLLRNYRRTIREARRLGRYVPPVVVAAAEAAMPGKKKAHDDRLGP
jgi:hypothetical protein